MIYNADGASPIKEKERESVYIRDSEAYRGYV